MIFVIQKVSEKSQKVPKNAKMAKKFPKAKKSVFKKRRDFIVLVLLSAHAKRVGFSLMQNFLI